jgi:hypothetical protein
MKRLIRAVAPCLLLAGCATSHVLVGTQRPEISPEEVRIYIDPPPQFEKIAILETSSEGSFALTNQQKTNKVIDRLKDEAASLGANGVLIQTIGSAQRGSVVNSFGSASIYGSGGSYTGYGTGFAIAAPVMVKEGAALAIYVPGVPISITPAAEFSPAPISQSIPSPVPSHQAAQADASALPPENGYVRPIMRAQQISTGMGCGQVSLAPTANGGSVFTAMCSSGDAILIDCRGLSCRPAMQGAVR